EFAQMVAKVGLGDEAEFRQHEIETLAALPGRTLGALQSKFVEGPRFEQKGSEFLEKRRASRIVASRRQLPRIRRSCTLHSPFLRASHAERTACADHARLVLSLAE